MRTVGVLEAKTHLSALIEEVEAGGEVVVTKHGRPAIKLVKAELEPPQRKHTGAELVAMMDALHAMQRSADPDAPPETWEEIKELGRQ